MHILPHTLASLRRWFISLIAVLSAVAIPAAPVWSAGVETAAVMAPSPTTCFLRGTPNDWGKTPVTPIPGTNRFEICQTFAGKPNPRFKICCCWNKSGRPKKACCGR